MEQANTTPLEDQKIEAIKHYHELADKACHFMSIIPEAIKYYFENFPHEHLVSQAASQAGFACGDLVAVSNIKNFPLSDTTLGLYRMKLGNEHFIDGFSCGYDYCILVKQK